ncbi:hypothetical protein pb186bvf_003394 [Paramecium bursaria]
MIFNIHCNDKTNRTLFNVFCTNDRGKLTLKKLKIYEISENQEFNLKVKEILINQFSFICNQYQCQYYYEIMNLTELNNLYTRQQLFLDLQMLEERIRKFNQYSQETFQTYESQGFVQSNARLFEQLQLIFKKTYYINDNFKQIRKNKLEFKIKQEFGRIDLIIQQKLAQSFQDAWIHIKQNLINSKSQIQNRLLDQLSQLTNNYEIFNQAQQVYDLKQYQQSLQICSKLQIYTYDVLFLKGIIYHKCKLIAKCYSKLKFYLQSIIIYNRLDVQCTLQNIGKAYMKVNEPFDAESKFSTIVTLQYPFHKAYEKLAIYFHKFYKFDKAIEMYDKALEINPNSVKQYINKGYNYQINSRDLSEFVMQV